MSTLRWEIGSWPLASATPLAQLLDKEKWAHQADALRQGLHMHRTVSALCVAPSTAFRWRRRYLLIPLELKAANLQGVVEAGETYLLRSCKG